VNGPQNNPAFTPANPRAPGYPWILLGPLMSVTIVEDYEVCIFHLCTPDLARNDGRAGR